MTLIDVENIIKELNNIDLTKNYTKKTFLEIVNEKCRNHMKKKTKSTDDKKLTNYNQFVKEHMKEIKEKYKDLTPKQHMVKLGELWQKHKKNEVM
tara:strand:- start:2868 stop:3152 length:285 start_codon:yes stop_codon:yes gene_type:complete